MMMVEHDDGCEARLVRSIERAQAPCAARVRAGGGGGRFSRGADPTPRARAKTADFERLAGAGGAEPQCEQTIESVGGRGGPHEIAQLAANGVSEPCLA